MDNITGILRVMADQEREPLTSRQCGNLLYAADTIDKLRARVAELEAELKALREQEQEPVAWRYQASGKYRYRGYVEGFDRDYQILKPVKLYAAPAPAQDVARDAETTDTKICFTCKHYDNDKETRPCRACMMLLRHPFWERGEGQ
jgi:hypothetical protein